MIFFSGFAPDISTGTQHRQFISSRYIIAIPSVQGPIDTKRQHQCSIITAMTFATQLSLTTMELHQNGLQPHSQVTPLWPMRLCRKCHRSVDADTWCKRVLTGASSMGYPPMDLGWGTPRTWDRVPPPDLGPGTPPPGIASTCYAAGGMPLAFTPEDFLVDFGLRSIHFSTNLYHQTERGTTRLGFKLSQTSLLVTPSRPPYTMY